MSAWTTSGRCLWLWDVKVSWALAVPATLPPRPSDVHSEGQGGLLGAPFKGTGKAWKDEDARKSDGKTSHSSLPQPSIHGPALP